MGLFGWISSYCRIKLNASLPLHIPFLPHALLRLILPQFGKMTSVYAGYYRQPTLLPTCTTIFSDCLSALQIYLSSTWQTFYSIIDQKFNTKKYLIRFWEFPCDKYICFLYLWWRISINSGWITSFASLGGKWCLWERKCCFWKISWIN